MNKEQRYELLEYMEQSQTLGRELTAADYSREMWLDLGDCLNDIEEAIYKLIGVICNEG